MDNKITVIGSINMDYMTIVDRLPEKGETLMSKKFKVSPGGKGANQAVAACKMGAQVFMIGAVGKDASGEDLKKIFLRENVIIDGIKTVAEPTGNAMITVDERGANTIVVFSGANNKVDHRHIDENIDRLLSSNIVMFQLEIPLSSVEYGVKLAKNEGKMILLNPAPAKELPADIYPYIDYITPNETELTLLTGCEDPKLGAQKLLEKGVKNVIITLGDKGCFFMNRNEEIYIPAFDVKPKDTTAAGDCFNGAFAVAIGEGKNIQEALIFANGAAGLSTEHLGAMESIPSKEEVVTFIQKNDLKNI